ncbi:hypothetical protein [Streptomyces sp. NPDC057363]|uniref:hypothetical protein n=1 Tax=Streptomyces sp. NPDC057363 TaxID=3346107 RepID=UPI00363DA1D7
MTTPQSVEPQHTPLTVVARLDEPRTRESPAGDGGDAEALDRTQLLEQLALSEVVARKAARGQPGQIGFDAAEAAEARAVAGEPDGR